MYTIQHDLRLVIEFKCIAIFFCKDLSICFLFHGDSCVKCCVCFCSCAIFFFKCEKDFFCGCNFCFSDLFCLFKCASSVVFIFFLKFVCVVCSHPFLNISFMFECVEDM